MENAKHKAWPVKLTLLKTLWRTMYPWAVRAMGRNRFACGISALTTALTAAYQHFTTTAESGNTAELSNSFEEYKLTAEVTE
jgi:hypothetical protein